jgi:hypothetical protein
MPSHKSTWIPTRGDRGRTPMGHQEDMNMETWLANGVRSYLAADQDSELEPRRLREVCTTLARILGRRLEGHEKWSRFYYVDDILPTSATIISPRELVVQGLLIWGQNRQNREWIEPLFASVRLPEDAGGLVVYQVMCGDASLGLGTTAYGAVRRSDQALPQEWIFTFSEEKR